MARSKRPLPPESDTAPTPFGAIAAGWRRENWIWRLGYLARVCRPYRPDLADYWESWIVEMNKPSGVAKTRTSDRSPPSAKLPGAAVGPGILRVGQAVKSGGS